MSIEKLTVETFTEKYCKTLQTDQDGQNFIKIPIADYESLSLFKYYITKAIYFISDSEIETKNQDVNFTIRTLTNLLLATSLLEESEGIDVLFEQQKKH